MRIELKKLVPMDLFIKEWPIRISLDYARSDNRLFGQAIYKNDARLWLYEDLAVLVLVASQLCHEKHRLFFVLHDGLRTTTAQEKMLNTHAVKQNPHWLEEPRLLSPPGKGAHPRGMAIDISLQDRAGLFIDMGTEFDFLANRQTAQHNPAHRRYKHSDEITSHRAMLDKAMLEASLRLNTPLQLLPQEWWDFRLKPNIYEEYIPLSDTDLPSNMRICDVQEGSTNTKTTPRKDEPNNNQSPSYKTSSIQGIAEEEFIEYSDSLSQKAKKFI